MKTLNIFIPITKIDVEKRLVYGIATAEQVDKSNEIMDYETTVPYYKAWSAEIEKASGGKSLGNLRSMHANIAAGKITQLIFNDAQKKIEICGKVVDDAEWKKVEEGVYTGFSQGGRYVKTWKDPSDSTLTRYTADPSEVSLVDNPCLGIATFEVVKADGASEMRKFKTKETTMPETAIDGKPVKPKTAPVQKWVASDGKAFDAKRDCELHELEIETAASAGQVTDPVMKALADLSKAVTDKEGKEPAADPKAVEKKEPTIEDKIAKLKAIVVKAAADVKKGFAEAYDAKTAIEALCIIECLISGEEWEAMMGEGEESQIADLKEAVSRLKTFIAAEIMEGEADGVTKLAKAGARHSAATRANLDKVASRLEEAGDHLDDAKKQHGHLGKAHEGLTKAHGALQDCMKSMGAIDLSKASADDLAALKKSTDENAEKIGAHLSDIEDHLDKAAKHMGKMSKSHQGIEASHDAANHALKEIGADPAAKADEPEDLKKLQGEVDQLKTENTALKTENGELKKTVTAVSEQLPTLAERVKNLEAQPMPGKGALYDNTNKGGAQPVAKGHEGQTDPAAPAEASPYKMNGMSPEQARQVIGGR